MGIIKDGKGTKHGAKVDSSNKLETRSVCSSEYRSAIVEGRVFAISSGVQTLTDTCASALVYVKNCDSRDMFLSKLNVIIGNSAGGCGDFTSTITINPSGGTLISGATVAPAVNLNFGSSLIADVTSFSGVEGSTVTGGVPVVDIHAEAERRQIFDVAVLPKGFSLAMSITPPPGNTSMQVVVTMAIEFIEER